MLRTPQKLTLVRSYVTQVFSNHPACGVRCFTRASRSSATGTLAPPARDTGKPAACANLRTSSHFRASTAVMRSCANSAVGPPSETLPSWHGIYASACTTNHTKTQHFLCYNKTYTHKILYQCGLHNYIQKANQDPGVKPSQGGNCQNLPLATNMKQYWNEAAQILMSGQPAWEI